eukprot:m.189039 g.189039  ORF g.189039 m.189039 type:complete len:71 (+) comp16737_c0_seq1:193-405(+)
MMASIALGCVRVHVCQAAYQSWSAQQVRTRLSLCALTQAFSSPGERLKRTAVRLAPAQKLDVQVDLPLRL